MSKLSSLEVFILTENLCIRWYYHITNVLENPLKKDLDPDPILCLIWDLDPDPILALKKGSRSKIRSIVQIL